MCSTSIQNTFFNQLCNELKIREVKEKCSKRKVKKAEFKF